MSYTLPTYSSNHLDPVARMSAREADENRILAKCEHCNGYTTEDDLREFVGCKLCPTCLVEWIFGTLEEDGFAFFQGFMIRPLIGDWAQRHGYKFRIDGKDYAKECRSVADCISSIEDTFYLSHKLRRAI